MKAELTLPSEFVDSIADRVIEKLKPMLSGNGTHEIDTLMTIEETAQFLKTSKGQIYQWTNNSAHGLNDVPFLKAGRLLRFSKKAILKWLESR
jgi:excisionase family DNA binding protein